MPKRFFIAKSSRYNGTKHIFVFLYLSVNLIVVPGETVDLMAMMTNGGRSITMSTKLTPYFRKLQKMM